MTDGQTHNSWGNWEGDGVPVQPKPFAWTLGLAAILAWCIYFTWLLAPFLAIASLMCAIREFRRARRTGYGRTGAAWGLGLACLAMVVSGFGCYGLATLGG
ncbi:hypothetical protein AB0F13_24195 [Streptomyces sp. NPDC026206]|uniref:hypothetical protein n=1 Tax=Streptomyces sp. NPDC026206 TaxID=3157089 RepID=UPI0033CC9879